MVNRGHLTSNDLGPLAIGDVSIAFVCVFIRGEWTGLLDLVITVVGAIGMRLLGAWIMVNGTMAKRPDRRPPPNDL